MANMYNINGLSYTTKENPEWFTRAMFGGRLIQGGYIRVLTGIKGDELLSQIDLKGKILQIDGKDCAWTPNQIIKLSEKKATIKTYKINLEQCIDELENKRTTYMLSPGAQNDELPPELEAATLMLISIGLSNEIEEMIIGGDETVDPNQFNGLQKQLLLSTEAAKIQSAVMTANNVLGIVETAYDAVAESVLQAEDAGTLNAFISYNARRLIRKALTTKDSQVVYSDWSIDDTDKKNPKLYYIGVELVPVKSINKDTVIFIDATNAFLTTDLLSDLEDIKMGQFPEPMESKVWIKGRLRLGFVIPFEDEAVISSPLATNQTANHGPQLRVVPNSLVFEADGETKTFTVYTDSGITPTFGAAATGFTVTPGTTTAGVTVVTVVAANNTGARDPRVGEIDVQHPTDVTIRQTVTLNQRNEDVLTIIP